MGHLVLSPVMSKKFRVLVTGSRDWPYSQWIERDLSDLFRLLGDLLVVVHGHCFSGADAIADRWCATTGVKTERFPAEWKKNGFYDPGAGYARNQRMVDTNPNLCLAYIFRSSRGATHCSDRAIIKGIPTVRREVDAL